MIRPLIALLVCLLTPSYALTQTNSSDIISTRENETAFVRLTD